jgi:hypothetical protein
MHVSSTAGLWVFLFLGRAHQMDDWYDEDERFDGLAFAEEKSLKSRFYNLGTALLDCAHRQIFSPLVHVTVKVR